MSQQPAAKDLHRGADDPRRAPPTSFDGSRRSIRRLGAGSSGCWSWSASSAALVAATLPRLRARSGNSARRPADRPTAPPRVSVATAHRAPPTQELTLPGNAQPFRGAALYARVNGYLKRWLVDIGDHVKEGQLLAEISTPDVDDQLAQARANLVLAKANLHVAEANLELAKITLERDVKAGARHRHLAADHRPGPGASQDDRRAGRVGPGQHRGQSRRPSSSTRTCRRSRRSSPPFPASSRRGPSTRARWSRPTTPAKRGRCST